MLLKLLRAHVLGDLSHENVVVDDFLWVGSEKVVVVGEGSAGLAWGELEVSELLASGLELVFLGDGHDRGVEWAVDVSSDLRDSGEDDAGLLLEVGGEFGARGDVLGEIVDVKVVLSAVGGVDHLHCCVFVCFCLYLSSWSVFCLIFG